LELNKLNVDLKIKHLDFLEQVLLDFIDVEEDFWDPDAMTPEIRRQIETAYEVLEILGRY